MKRHILLALIAMALVSCGGTQQQQNPSDESPTVDTAAVVEPTPEPVAEVETIEEEVPSGLVFEDCDFERSADAGSRVIPQVLQNATRIVFDEDVVRFSDGTNEFTISVDLEKSYEDVSSDGYYSWTFVVKDNADLPRVNVIYIETSYPVEVMEKMEPIMGAESAPLKITVDNMANYYPKRFKQWDSLKRKMLPSFPTDEEYHENMDWANTDHSAEALEE